MKKPEETEERKEGEKKSESYSITKKRQEGREGGFQEIKPSMYNTRHQRK